nr:hypothetical protein [Tanacetum cinerariifolium]
MSSAKIDQIVAQRVTNANESIAVYEKKIRLAHDSMNQVVHQGTTAARNANKKTKWGSDHDRNYGQQKNKRREVVRVHIAGLGNKNGYPETLPNYNKSRIVATNQRAPVANQKAIVICYECGRQGHYKSECPKLKNQNYGNQKGNEGKSYEDPNVIKDNADA